MIKRSANYYVKILTWEILDIWKLDYFKIPQNLQHANSLIDQRLIFEIL